MRKYELFYITNETFIFIYKYLIISYNTIANIKAMLIINKYTVIVFYLVSIFKVILKANLQNKSALTNNEDQ